MQDVAPIAPEKVPRGQGLQELLLLLPTMSDQNPAVHDVGADDAGGQ
jgi:hypothetical protein